MRVARPEQHPVRHDDGSAPARLQQAQEQRQKQQLGLLGLNDPLQILRRVLIIKRPGERRVRQHQRVGLFLAGVVLSQRVAVADIRVLHAVQEHIHAPDSQHGRVEVEPVERVLMKMLLELRVAEDLFVVLAQVLAGRDEETGRAAGWIADNVLGPRRRHLHHELDDVARRAELPVGTGGGDLAEHVLVEVALGVAVLHRHLAQEVDHLGQQGGCGDGEARVFHVVRVGGAVSAEGAQEGEDVLIHDGEEIGRLERLEAGPAELVVRAAFGVVAFGEHAPLDWLLEPGGLVLF